MRLGRSTLREPASRSPERPAKRQATVAIVESRLGSIWTLVLANAAGDANSDHRSCQAPSVLLPLSRAIRLPLAVEIESSSNLAGELRPASVESCHQRFLRDLDRIAVSVGRCIGGREPVAGLGVVEVFSRTLREAHRLFGLAKVVLWVN